MIYPQHLQIETVAGICSARCVMCTIEESPRVGVMDNLMFEKILDKFLPVKQHLRFTTLHGLGEPLLDKDMPTKIRIAKELGFPIVGFATNATCLDDNRVQQLLDAKLDTIIFSIDGFLKKTHESIRKRTDFGEVISNVLNFISLRNKIGKTKVIVRMIRQKLNQSEWSDYFHFWSKNLRKEFGDQVSVFDVHNWGGDYGNEVQAEIKEKSRDGKIICSDIYERFFIYLNGDVGFCCGDEQGWFDLGNVLKDEPQEIYNNAKFSFYRTMMQEGKICELEHCNNCSIILSRFQKQYINTDET